MEFDPNINARWLTTAIRSRHSHYIVADEGGKIVGLISYHIDDSFSAKPLAVLGEVYALAEYRKSFIGRRLVLAAMDMAKNHSGANCMHIPLSSGHKAMPTLVNLFKKFGAEEIGVIMRKVL
jgi:GNAT superfamily N-acetyltransferase